MKKGFLLWYTWNMFVRILVSIKIVLRNDLSVIALLGLWWCILLFIPGNAFGWNFNQTKTNFTKKTKHLAVCEFWSVIFISTLSWYLAEVVSSISGTTYGIFICWRISISWRKVTWLRHIIHDNHGTLIPHCNNVIMSAMASQITSLTIVYSNVYSGADQRKLQSSASLAFMSGIHQFPAQRASTAEHISIGWRHHEQGN